MQQEYFVVVVAHSLHGRLRRTHIPHVVGFLQNYDARHMPFGFASHLPGTFEYITFLRDPVARTVSDYHFARQHSSNPASAAARRLSLADFVRGNYGTSSNGYAHWLSNAVFGATFSTDVEPGRAVNDQCGRKLEAAESAIRVLESALKEDRLRAPTAWEKPTNRGAVRLLR